jgi:hypothetical protein
VYTNGKVNEVICKWYMLVARLGEDVVGGFFRWWVLRVLSIYYGVEGVVGTLIKRIVWET